MNTFPGGSKSRVNLAGDNIRNKIAIRDDFTSIKLWRESHRRVLNTFQSLLRTRTKHSNIIVAQRHKRLSTIFNKLDRYPKMKLSRMDDVAGCRLIFNNLEELYIFRNKLHTARFRHKLKNTIDKYDYIKQPKHTGYRSVHDIYSYDVNSYSGKDIKGLLIEIQYRTSAQHAWATTVEIVGQITDSQPKFEQGEKKYLEIFRYCSEIISRAHENSFSCLPNIESVDLVKKFLSLDRKIGLMTMLRGLNAADSEIFDRKNIILILSKRNTPVEIKSYKYAPQALLDLFTLEELHPENDIVFVRGDNPNELREAFKNYFSDARDFIELLENGCEILSGRKIYNLDY